MGSPTGRAAAKPRIGIGVPVDVKRDVATLMIEVSGSTGHRTKADSHRPLPLWEREDNLVLLRWSKPPQQGESGLADRSGLFGR